GGWSDSPPGRAEGRVGESFFGESFFGESCFDSGFSRPDFSSLAAAEELVPVVAFSSFGGSASSFADASESFAVSCLPDTAAPDSLSLACAAVSDSTASFVADCNLSLTRGAFSRYAPLTHRWLLRPTRSLLPDRRTRPRRTYHQQMRRPL